MRSFWFLAFPRLLFLTLLLAGCGPEAPVGAAVAVGSFPLTHRTPVDALVSLVSGHDCSVVYIDRDERYCKPKELPLDPPVFCTRSLGVPDCWADPEKLAGKPREIADGPRVLTPRQEDDRTKRWPVLW